MSIVLWLCMILCCKLTYKLNGLYDIQRSVLLSGSCHGHQIKNGMIGSIIMLFLYWFKCIAIIFGQVQVFQVVRLPKLDIQ
jgi:hypothetical protein